MRKKKKVKMNQPDDNLYSVIKVLNADSVDSPETSHLSHLDESRSMRKKKVKMNQPDDNVYSVNKVLNADSIDSPKSSHLLHLDESSFMRKKKKVKMNQPDDNLYSVYKVLNADSIDSPESSHLSHLDEGRPSSMRKKKKVKIYQPGDNLYSVIKVLNADSVDSPEPSHLSHLDESSSMRKKKVKMNQPDDNLYSVNKVLNADSIDSPESSHLLHLGEISFMRKKKKVKINQPDDLYSVNKVFNADSIDSPESSHLSHLDESSSMRKKKKVKMNPPDNNLYSVNKVLSADSFDSPESSHLPHLYEGSSTRKKKKVKIYQPDNLSSVIKVLNADSVDSPSSHLSHLDDGSSMHKKKKKKVKIHQPDDNLYSVIKIFNAESVESPESSHLSHLGEVSFTHKKKNKKMAEKNQLDNTYSVITKVVNADSIKSPESSQLWYSGDDGSICSKIHKKHRKRQKRDMQETDSNDLPHTAVETKSFHLSLQDKTNKKKRKTDNYNTSEKMNIEDDEVLYTDNYLSLNVNSSEIDNRKPPKFKKCRHKQTEMDLEGEPLTPNVTAKCKTSLASAEHRYYQQQNTSKELLFKESTSDLENENLTSPGWQLMSSTDLKHVKPRKHKPKKMKHDGEESCYKSLTKNCISESATPAKHKDHPKLNEVSAVDCTPLVPDIVNLHECTKVGKHIIHKGKRKKMLSLLPEENKRNDSLKLAASESCVNVKFSRRKMFKPKELHSDHKVDELILKEEIKNSDSEWVESSKFGLVSENSDDVQPTLDLADGTVTCKQVKKNHSTVPTDVDIQITWPLNLLHNRVLSIVSANEKKEFRAQGIKYKQGHWTREEENTLLQNWSAFQKKYNVSDASGFLDLGRKYDDLKRKFIQYLAKGLDDRSLIAIYQKCRQRLSGEVITGRLSPEELNTLGCLFKIHGPQWKVIGKKMKRSPVSLQIIYNRSFRKESGKWTSEEDNKLMKTVCSVVGDDNCVFGNKKLIYNLPWEKISSIVGTRNGKQCRDRWVHQLYRDLNPYANQVWGFDTTVEFLELLRKTNVKNSFDVNWRKLSKKIRIASPSELQMKWYRLKSKRASEVKSLTFQETIDYLLAHYYSKS